MNLINPSVSNPIVNEKGEVFASLRSLANQLGVSRYAITNGIKKNGYYRFGNHTYTLTNGPYP